MELLGIYIHNDLLYYQLRVANNSNVGYDVSGLRLSVRDKKVSKRTAVQELEVLPAYVHGNILKLEGNSESVLVYAVAKHTIPDKKYLAIQLMEKNGGRHLQLKVRNRILVKARPL
jgi:conjugative transposon TraN protein